MTVEELVNRFDDLVNAAQRIANALERDDLIDKVAERLRREHGETLRKLAEDD